MEVAVPMCADFLHVGHINLLNIAAQHGKVSVWLITDEAMKSYKRKPYFLYEDRKTIVQSLKQVHDVFPCPGPHKFTEMLTKYTPKVFVHGDDWKTGVQSDARKRVYDHYKVYSGYVVEPPYTTGISSSMVHNALK